ncbi:hypothetical protein DNTS_031948 [Danionella cerebrum]|uniref:Uncharacterized protein n=1 Tax=Danionella cerebrum TaxID=2873325 RepID=A0A553PED1_9TELE|nr:hypothetical protein DNTS_031948 [Danionella translucida]
MGPRDKSTPLFPLKKLKLAFKLKLEEKERRRRKESDVKLETQKGETPHQTSHMALHLRRRERSGRVEKRRVQSGRRKNESERETWLSSLGELETVNVENSESEGKAKMAALINELPQLTFDPYACLKTRSIASLQLRQKGHDPGDGFCRPQTVLKDQEVDCLNAAVERQLWLWGLAQGQWFVQCTHGRFHDEEDGSSQDTSLFARFIEVFGSCKILTTGRGEELELPAPQTFTCPEMRGISHNGNNRRRHEALSISPESTTNLHLEAYCKVLGPWRSAF